MIDADFVTYLIDADGSDGVYSLVGDRVYAEQLPQNPTLPAISYTRVYTSHPEEMDGGADLAGALIQVSCWAASKKEAAQVAALVIARMTGRGGNGFQKAGIEDERSSKEGPELYRRDVDVRIAYIE